jgi:hypothetical protein
MTRGQQRLHLLQDLLVWCGRRTARCVDNTAARRIWAAFARAPHPTHRLCGLLLQHQCVQQQAQVVASCAFLPLRCCCCCCCCCCSCAGWKLLCVHAGGAWMELAVAAAAAVHESPPPAAPASAVAAMRRSGCARQPGACVLEPSRETPCAAPCCKHAPWCVRCSEWHAGRTQLCGRAQDAVMLGRTRVR